MGVDWKRIRTLFLGDDRVPPPYAMRYFDHLYSEYNTLVARARSAHVAEDSWYKEIIENAKQKYDESSIAWYDLCSAEIAILELLKGEDLRCRALMLRERYRDIVDDHKYKSYDDSLPNNIKDLSKINAKECEEVLRADLENLLLKIYWNYESTSQSTRLRYNAKWWVALFLLLITGSVFIKIGIDWNEVAAEYRGQFPIALIVAILGACGACLSFLRRLSQLPSNIESLGGIIELRRSYVDVFVAMVSGALFAILLYILFASNLPHELFSTNLVPKFKDFDQADNPSTLVWFISNLKLEDRKAMAIMFIWAFIAGFAEQLVPDVINRIIKLSQLKESDKSKS